MSMCSCQSLQCFASEFPKLDDGEFPFHSTYLGSRRSSRWTDRLVHWFFKLEGGETIQRDLASSLPFCSSSFHHFLDSLLLVSSSHLQSPCILLGWVSVIIVLDLEIPQSIKTLQSKPRANCSSWAFYQFPSLSSIGLSELERGLTIQFTYSRFIDSIISYFPDHKNQKNLHDLLTHQSSPKAKPESKASSANALGKYPSNRARSRATQRQRWHTT